MNDDKRPRLVHDREPIPFGVYWNGNEFVDTLGEPIERQDDFDLDKWFPRREEFPRRMQAPGTYSPPPPVSLGEKRAEKDSRKWTPLEMLKSMVRDIEAGTHPTDAVVIVRILPPKEPGGYNGYSYRIAGDVSDAHLVLGLEFAKAALIKEYVDE